MAVTGQLSLQIGAHEGQYVRHFLAPFVLVIHDYHVRMQVVLEDFHHQAMHGASDRCDLNQKRSALNLIGHCRFQCSDLSCDASNARPQLVPVSRDMRHGPRSYTLWGYLNCVYR